MAIDYVYFYSIEFAKRIIRYRVCLQYFIITLLIPGNGALKKEIRKADVLYCDVLLQGFHCKGAGQIGFATAGSTGDEDVQAIHDVFAGRQFLD